MIDLSPNHLETVKRILTEHVPDCEVRAFGSRATWTAKDYSDLDLAVVGEDLLDRKALSRLKEAFQESDLPIRVDVLDWHGISESFRKVIERDYVVVQEGAEQATAGDWRKHDVSALIKEKALVIGDGYRAKNTELSKAGLPFARAGNIGNGFQFSGAACFPADELHKVGEKISRPGDTVFTSKGTVGRFAFVRDDTPPFVYSPQLSYWRPLNTKMLEPRFLYYWMSSEEFFSQFKSVAGQTDMAEYVSLRDQRQMRITLPPLPEQRAIAHILGTLDDKIELNRRMNETLEEMARALFKSWFVDFDPVRAKMEGRDSGLPPDIADLFPDRLVPSELGEIPEGWEVKTLGDLITVVKGRSYRSSELAESDTALVTLKSFAKGGGYRPDGLKPYTGRYKPEQVVKPGEVVLACTDVTQAAEVIGRPAMVPQNQQFNTLVASLDTLIIRPREPAIISILFLYSLMSAPSFTDHVHAYTSGTTVLHLRKDGVLLFKFPTPPPNFLSAFKSLTVPAFEQLGRSLFSLASIATLRDTLLPKLVSGRIRLRDATTQAEAAR